MSLPFRKRKTPKPEIDPFAPPHWDDALQAPGPLLMLMEARAPWEYAAMLAAAPWLSRLPAGDGHPVLVFPGLGASDFTHAAAAQLPARPRLHALPVEAGFQLRPAPRRARRLPRAWWRTWPRSTTRRSA